MTDHSPAEIVALRLKSHLARHRHRAPYLAIRPTALHYIYNIIIYTTIYNYIQRLII